MEFQNLGKHCSEVTCKQIDFLPFNCKFCKQTFCLDHRDVTSHQCPKANMGDHQVVICKICLKTLTYDVSTISKEDYLNLHYATGCNPENYAKVKEERSRKCKGNGCKAKLTPLNTYTCKNCKKELCLKHRYEDEHECTYNPVKKGKFLEEAKKGISALLNRNQNTRTHNHDNGNCASEYNREFCTVCGRGFNNLDDLINHAQRAHY